MAHDWSKKGIEGHRKTHGGAYPPGQEPKPYDPSKAWADSLSQAKLNWMHQEATRPDSFALGLLPKKEAKSSEVLREYTATRKLQIAGGATPTESDISLGIVKKEEKEGESVADAQVRLIERSKMLADLRDKTESSLGEGILEDHIEVIEDSLGFSERLDSLGVKNYKAVASAVRKLSAIAPKYKRILAEDGDKAAADYLLKETGLTREQAISLQNMFK